MWQQTGVWGLHEGLQLCGLGVGADGFPAGPGRAAGGAVSCRTPACQPPCPAPARLHPPNDNTLHCYSQDQGMDTLFPPSPDGSWLPGGSSVVQEKALHRKLGSLALGQVPFPLWASLSRRTGRELDSGQCPDSSPGMPTPRASFTPSCSSNPVAPPLV